MQQMYLSSDPPVKHLQRAIRSVLDVLMVFTGIVHYYITGNAPAGARLAAIRLHCRTNGLFTESMAPPLRRLRPARNPRTVTGFLGTLSVAEQKLIADGIRENGFHVFEKPLPDAIVDELVAFAKQQQAFVPGFSKTPEERYAFDETKPLGKKYSIIERELVRSPAMQQLMADPSFLAVSETYLRTHPMMADVTLWWSAVHPVSGGEDAGQFYHFDFDTPPGWLMFFFYLTDVDSQHGPHMYIRGSHKPGHPAAAALRKRGYQRIDDAEVEAAFGKENALELLGKRGTILAVDTRGFHKGKPLEAGSRLMAQLIYTFPQFAGAHVARQPLPDVLHPSLVRAIAETPRLYQKFI